MKKSKAMLFIAPALFSYALAAQACTTLAIQDKQGDIFHGRTLVTRREHSLIKKRRMAARG